MESRQERGLLLTATERRPVKDPVRSFVSDLEAVRPGGLIRIYCGEASPEFYNDPLVLGAIKAARQERGARIHVSAGPLIVADGSGYNGLLSLTDGGTVGRLRHRPTRGKVEHFRVVDTDHGSRVYMETPHSPLTPMDERQSINLESLSPEQHQGAIERVITHFDRTLRHRSLRTANAMWHEPPLLTTLFGLRVLIEAASERKLDFDTLRPTELGSLLPDEPSTPWCSVPHMVDRFNRQWIAAKVSAFDRHRRPERGFVVAHSPGRDGLAADFEKHAYPGATKDASFYVFLARPRPRNMTTPTIGGQSAPQNGGARGA